MEDFVILNGDTVQFIPQSFQPALLTMSTAFITAAQLSPVMAGFFTVNGRIPCVEGDEQRAVVVNCSYTSGPYQIPGFGTLRIETLPPVNYAQNTRIGGKRVLVKGSPFPARFDVVTPAQLPPTPPAFAPVPDPMPFYRGLAMFMTSNTTKRVS